MSGTARLRRLATRVVEIEDATHDIRVVRLAPVDGPPLAFRAGQYARLGFADLPMRDYSMASRPADALLEFHIRNVGDGASGYVAHRLEIGEIVGIEGPLGDAYLRESHLGPVIAIAGGSGLAPMKSIVETALAAMPARPVHFYFGARDERDIYLERRLRELEAAHPEFRFVPVLSEPSGPSARRQGLVGDAVAADFNRFDGAKAYLAGPPAMVESVIEMLQARGLPAEDIHADPFYSEEENRRRRGPA
jgi:CDP-4-dehydro-6-deoxyglucose reductase/ferredoxin-NAD(P)+ reductase (naphthalene dioxygenase ferredoxin-specific)